MFPRRVVGSLTGLGGRLAPVAAWSLLHHRQGAETNRQYLPVFFLASLLISPLLVIIPFAVPRLEWQKSRKKEAA